MKLEKVNKDNLKDYIYNTKWTSKWGMLYNEIEPLINHLRSNYAFNEDKYNDAMMCNTCMMHEGKIVNYHCDVLLALNCALENRDQKVEEWD